MPLKWAMQFALNLQSRTPELAAELEGSLNAAGADLAPAAFAIARVEYPALETARYMDRLEEMGARAARRLGPSVATSSESIKALNEYLYDEEGFAGNRDRYDDPRNSFLNEVLDRRTGIPITLAVVYLELARRAGLNITGINFPGHFLLRAPGLISGDDLIIDPFHGGALLSEFDCRQLLRTHVGDDAAFDRSLLAPATRSEIVVRMLVNLKRLYVRMLINLKRIYVHMRSFPQARDVTELLLAMTPSALSELRDRGLLAYHLNDVTGALRDLQTYLKLSSLSELDKESREEQEQIWEHVKTLRRRVASLN